MNLSTPVRANRAALLTALVIGALLFLPGTVAAGTYLDVLEHIAEDIEEIHEDMHKVAFALKVMSWASVANVLLLAAIVLALLRRKAG